MRQLKFTQRPFLYVIVCGSLAALIASIMTMAIRLFTFGYFFGELCDDFCDLPSKLLLATPLGGILGTILMSPVVLTVGIVYALYIGSIADAYNADKFKLRFMPFWISVGLAIGGLIWCFPILNLGNPVQTPENTVMYILLSVLTGFLFPIISALRRVPEAS